MQALIAYSSPLGQRVGYMRTYQDSKAMAKSLRKSLATKKISLSHSECLEIIAHQFGFAELEHPGCKHEFKNRFPGDVVLFLLRQVSNRGTQSRRGGL